MLADHVQGGDALGRSAALIVGGSLVLAMSAKIQVPFWPEPMTPGYMAGPTVRYLLGFLLGAACIGWLAERGRDRILVGAFAAMALGHVILFVPGVLWLAFLLGWTKAVAVGVVPFVPAMICKTALGPAMMSAF